MARAGVEITGLKQAQDRIGDVANRAREPLPAPVARQVLRELQASERRRFATGRGWRKLTPRWVAYKRTHGFDTRKLVMTGGLERSLTHGGGDVRFIASRYQIVFGLAAKREYMILAHTRRPVMIDRDARKEIPQIVQRYIGQGRR